MKLLTCKHCGNIVQVIKESGVSIQCCGENMNELKANDKDGAVEKHVPVVNINVDKVEVSIGSTLHPMLEKHYIQWIYLETNKGIQKKSLAPNDEPKAEFLIDNDEKVVAVYEYCNLHGLWKKDI